ncbi:MAG TPA: ATP-binding cassette domain-containing protein, partial [Draconibacterium sp.]|nr:ATP-binding cassette domain-containing protein [Draconibacterium sp.]
MKIIEIKNLHKVYNDNSVSVRAVNGVDLVVEEGEFTAIVGPSGSGKTTLLNIIGGLDDATEGTV